MRGDCPAETGEPFAVWFQGDRIDLAVAAFSAMSHRVVDCVPVEAEYLAAGHVDDGGKQGVAPAGTREEFVVGVFGNAGH